MNIICNKWKYRIIITYLVVGTWSSVYKFYVLFTWLYLLYIVYTRFFFSIPDNFPIKRKSKNWVGRSKHQQARDTRKKYGTKEWRASICTDEKVGKHATALSSNINIRFDRKETTIKNTVPNMKIKRYSY